MTRSRWDRYRSSAEMAAAEREAARGDRVCFTPEALQHVLRLRLAPSGSPCLVRLGWPTRRRGCTWGGRPPYRCPGCGHSQWWRHRTDNWTRGGRLVLVTSHVYAFPGQRDMRAGLRELVAEHPRIGAALLPTACDWYAGGEAHLLVLYSADLEPELEMFEHFSSAYRVRADPVAHHWPPRSSRQRGLRLIGGRR